MELSTQVRANGKVTTVAKILYGFYDYYEKAGNLNPYYDKAKNLLYGLEKSGTYSSVTPDGEPLYVDTYIGTDIEYRIHYALVELGKINTQSAEYAIKEKEVEDIMREWRNENA